MEKNAHYYSVLKIDTGCSYQTIILTQLFDAVIITATPHSIPTHFINRLARNNRLIAAEGEQNIWTATY